MPDASLLELFELVRGRTLKVLHGLDDERARWAPQGLRNSCLWHGGHSYVVAETLVNRAVGGDVEIPEGWFGMFSWESDPSTVAPGDWPALADVVAALDSQAQRLRAAIADCPSERLDASASDAGNTGRREILRALHDEARHSGEISLLRKLQDRSDAANA